LVELYKSSTHKEVWEALPPSWEIAVAVGSLIKQEIFRDSDQLPYSHWDVTDKRIFNVRFLTPLLPSLLPAYSIKSTNAHIRANIQVAGRPTHHHEEKALEEDMTTIKDNIQSVGVIDEDLAEKGAIRPAEYVGD
jgi:hypothetical protein